MNKKFNLSDRVFQGLLLMVSILFYVFFTVIDGAVICVDSPTYISMSLAREPVYPLYLAFFRLVFGDGERYLFAAVFVQGLISAFAAWSLSGFLTKEFKRTRIDNMILLAVPLLVSLLCKFAAKRAVMYSNSIMSEGICIPLFLIFARWLLEYCFRKNEKALIISAILSVIMISARKQMLVTVVLLVLAVLFSELKKKNWLKTLGKACIYGVIIFLCVSGIDRGYNFALRGEGVRHSSGDRFLLTVVFYEAEREHADEIEDSEIRELFLEIYDVCDESGYLGNSAGDGWYNRVDHFTNHYDKIQIDTMWPMIREYVNANMTGSEVELEAEIDRIMDVITKSLIGKEAIGILRVFVDNVFAGLVVTVAKQRKILVIYAIIAYSSMVLLWAWNWKKRGFRSRENILALYTAVSVLLNVAAVSAVIFCQTRYMIYNMPLFYMCGWLLLRAAWELRGKRKETEVENAPERCR